MNRRELLRAAIGGGTGLALVGLHRACLAGANLDAIPDQTVLDADLRRVLSAIAECIIPETDTPGAITAGVPQFAELILSDWYTPEERQPVLDGMLALDDACFEKHGRGFAACSADEQAVALGAVQDSEMFKVLKSLVVNGYFTSELGATSQPGYDPMPGVYKEVVYDATTGRWS